MSIICRKVGNSITATIPNEIIKKMGIKPGDEIDVSEDGKVIILTPVKKRLRGEIFVENFYNKPIEQVGKIETDPIDWGKPVGEEIW